NVVNLEYQFTAETLAARLSRPEPQAHQFFGSPEPSGVSERTSELQGIGRGGRSGSWPSELTCRVLSFSRAMICVSVFGFVSACCVFVTLWSVSNPTLSPPRRWKNSWVITSRWRSSLRESKNGLHTLTRGS